MTSALILTAAAATALAVAALRFAPGEARRAEVRSTRRRRPAD